MPGSGIFGLPFSPEESRVVVIPVPFEATVSYRAGTARGPEAILAASRQIDLYDHDTGRPYEHGIAMLPIPRHIERQSRAARRAAEPVLAAGGLDGTRGTTRRRLAERVAEVDRAGDAVNVWVSTLANDLRSRDQLPVVVGGDHSVPFGAIESAAKAHPGLGILHLDAHADLRQAYEGFTWSHASIFYNVTERLPGVAKLVQVGIRDVGVAEAERIRESKGRIVAFWDSDLAGRRLRGEKFSKIADEIVATLPKKVYLSWDIDGLDPTLCPHTGTPVPGGLAWDQALELLRALVRGKRRIVGADLCEVSPGPDEWDANVGARLLYKMIGFMLRSLE